jgi:hypothetical protein
MVQAQRIQLMVLENSTTETKKAILDQVTKFTMEVLNIREKGENPPSPTVMRQAREELESIRGSSAESHP